jgi:hypothetical protein
MCKKKPGGRGTRTNMEEPEKKSTVKFVMLPAWQCFEYAESI